MTSALLALLLGLALALLLAEAGLRALVPPLRVQVFRSSPQLQIHDTPVGPWWQNRSLERTLTGCPDPAAGPRVVVLGSSIFFGSATAPEDSLGVTLHRSLGGACVEVLAEPGYTFPPQYARAREALAGRTAEVLLWEIWQSSPLPVTRLGDRVYNFGPLSGASGRIPDPWGLGDLNLALLRWSRVYELILTNTAPHQTSNMHQTWTQFAAEALPRMQSLAAETGARLLLVTCPALDRPFTAQQTQRDQTYGPLLEAARAAQVPLLDLGRALGDTPPEAIRADPCCHWNAAGTLQITEILVDFVRESGGLP